MTETILIGIIVAIVAGLIGKFLGGYNRVSNDHCNERRQACNKNVMIELRAIKDMLRQHMASHDHNNIEL